MFKLQGGLIVPTGSVDENVIINYIIAQTALYLESLLPTIKNIGLGWGTSMGSLIEAMRPQKPRENLDWAVCPIVGSAPYAIQCFQTNELVRIFAQKTGYEPHYLHAPAFPGSEDNKKLFENTSEYQKISKLWDKLDTVILGVGTYPSVPDQATAARFGSRLREKKAVGMIVTYCYDIDGKIIDSENDIVTRIPLESLKKAKRALAFGGGEKKFRALRGALMTGLITHLITDEVTAREVVGMSS
jgi:deoxyribonucleoside regulator